MTDTMERVRSDDAVSTLDRVPALAEARALFLEGSPQDAAVLLRDLARGFPGDAEILNDLGVVCHACGAQQEAEAVLDRAYEISPDDPEIVRNLARVSLSCGMYQRSIDLAARAVQLDGGDALADIVQQAGGKIEQLALYPRFISIETASVCNARCHFCSTPEVKRMAFMKRKTWQKIVDDNREAGVEFRLNMDGEPTLHKELAEIVAYIKSTTNCTATFNTNGERLDAALAEALLDAGLDGIRFSIDGFRKETFEKHRIGLSYNRVVSSVLGFLEAREKREHSCFVEVRMIRFPNNEDERDAFAMFWSSFPRVKVCFTTPYYWPSTGQGSVQAPCVRGEDDFELYYYTDGRTTMCCMDWQEKAVLGDGNKYTTREIWNHPLAKSWRQALRNGDRHLIPVCSDCNQDLSRDAHFEVGTD